MKFSCTKENLVHVLDALTGIAGRHAHLPILSNILIQVKESGVQCSATNLEIGMRANLRAKVEQEGSFTVPAKTLGDFVRLLPENQVHISLEGNELFIQCGASSTKIKGTSGDEFPVIPDVEEAHGYSMLHTAFKEALSKAVIAVAKNDIRPELSGVYFGFFTPRFNGLVLAATDSYRLAEKRVSVPQGTDEARCIVPARTVLEMIRLLSSAKSMDGETQVRLMVSDNQIALRYDAFELTSRLIDGTYPDYAQIIPNDFQTTALFPLEDMTIKIKAASLFTTSGVNAVSFDMNAGEGTVGVSSTSTQTGEHSSSVEAAVTGAENSILLNYRYVLDGLSQMDGGNEAQMRMNGSDTPCVFQEKGNNTFLYIVMPVRQ